MLEGSKISAAVSAALESREIYRRSIFDCLESEFGKEEWYKGAKEEYDRVRLIAPDIVGDYYKSKESTSIEIVADNAIAKLFGNHTDNQIFKRLFKTSDGLDKIKASYVKNNNLNFGFLIEMDDDLRIGAITKSQFLSKSAYILELISIRAALSMYGRKSAQYGGTIRDFLLLIHSGIERNMINNGNGQQRSYINNIRRTLSYSKDERLANLFEKYHSTGEYKKTIQTFLLKCIIESSMSSIGKNETMQLSTFVNGVLNYQEKVAKELNVNSKAVKYEYTNPVSGFVSIKTKRVQLENSTLPQHEFERLVKVHQEINKVYENAANVVIEYQITQNKNKETVLRLVSGEEIISLYEITSYHGYGRMNNNLGLSLGPAPALEGGSLYNSCMRNLNNRDRISFYANNPHFIKMIAVVSKASNKLKARAIVWYDKDSDMHYVDRIFFIDEKSKGEITAFIRKNKNFCSIYSGNGTDSGLKYTSEFAIPFKGCIPVINPPYFDSINHHLFKNKDGLYFIGRPSNNHEGTNIAFYSAGFINKNFSTDRVSCAICGSQQTVKAGSINICERHMKIDAEGRVYAVGSKVYMPYEDQSKYDDAAYIMNPISVVKNRGIVPLSSLNEIKVNEALLSRLSVRYAHSLNGSSSFYSLIAGRLDKSNNKDCLSFVNNERPVSLYHDDTVEAEMLCEAAAFFTPKDKNVEGRESFIKFKDSVKALYYMSTKSDSTSINLSSIFKGNEETVRELVRIQLINGGFGESVTNKLNDLVIRNPFNRCKIEEFVTIEKKKYSSPEKGDGDVYEYSMLIPFKTKNFNSTAFFIPISLINEECIAAILKKQEDEKKN